MQQSSVLYDPRSVMTPSGREFADRIRQSRERLAQAAAQATGRPPKTTPPRPFLPLEFGKAPVTPETVTQWKARQKSKPIPVTSPEEISAAIAQIDTRVLVLQELVAEFYGVKVRDLRGRHRVEGVMMPRHVAVWLGYNVLKQSYPKLALRFGGKDHATLINSVRRVDACRVVDPDLQEELNGLTAEIRMRIA